MERRLRRFASLRAMPPDERVLFERDGGDFVPTPLCRGPWYPDTQHGTPMLALLARAVESLPCERPMQVTRLSVDLMRAAPLRPVRTEARVHRAGRNVEYLEASLRCDGAEYARATAMRTRVGEVAVPADVDGRSAPLPPLPPDAVDLAWGARSEDTEEALHQAFEVRPVPGFETPTAWFRLGVPLVRGEPLSPLLRVTAASDFVYGVAVIRRHQLDPKYFLRQPFVAINPDTTLNLHRPLEGEWVCLDTRTTVDAIGAATACARLYDARGPIGFATQSLLVRGPEAAPDSWKRYRGGSQ